MIRRDETDLDWMQYGACLETDPNLFTSDGQGTNNSVPAKRICATCDATAECLAYALRNGSVGTWGGTTEKERQHIRKAAA